MESFSEREERPARRSIARRSANVSRNSILTNTVEPPSSLRSEAADQTSSPNSGILASIKHTEALGDITAKAINGNHQSGADFIHEKSTIPAQALSLDKPMEMVIRARASAQIQATETKEARQRTVIKYLILENFKSYAGRQEVGPFHASFSSVVGPNGSGKSNVIDSLLFVFGFRASKMRQGKISSLIHNSTAFPDLDYCEVQVHFEEVRDLPDGGKEIIPASALIISRRAFRNNSSKYFINSKESNFTAVTTLLKDRGVDLDHKRFLILQGEVESIAQMKPKALNEHDDGLLEYLEDIIGTSKFKMPIQESVAETEVLNETCAEKNSRVQHVEKEKKNLEGKRNAAVNYIRDENDLAIKESALCQIFVHECEDNIQVSQEAVDQLQAQLDVELEKHSGSQADIQGLEKQYEIHAEQCRNKEEAVHAMVSTIAKADKETVKLDERRKHFTTKIRKLEKTLAMSHASLAETTAYLQRLSDDIERNGQDVTAIERSLEVEERQLTDIREGLRGKTEGLSQEISVKQTQMEPWMNQMNEKKSAIAIAQSELSILLGKQDANAQALSKIDARLTELQADQNMKLREVNELQSAQQAKQKGRAQLQAKLDKLLSSEEQLRARLSLARQQTDEARSSLAKSQTQGAVLAGLERLRESGRVTGFHGRLGNLATIDQKYDVAISTACPTLDNIVVDTVEAGQQCIEHLRKNHLGRANFILLDRLGKRDLSSIETPENVPRLFDLVRSKEERFKPAFYSIMQNTLVAEDLKQANRIAYGGKRWRVVTLDGQLIDKSGTMSGGGTRIAKGAMSSKLVEQVTKEQVAELEAKQDAEEQRMQSLQLDTETLATSINNINEELPELDTQMQRLRLDLDCIERDHADNERRRSELATLRQPDKGDMTRVSSLKSSVELMEREFLDLQGNTISIEADIKDLQDRIMEIGGVKLRMQKAKVDGLREQVRTLLDEASTASSNQTKTRKQHEKHGKVRADAAAELASITVDMGKLDEEITQHSQAVLKSRQQVEEKEEELERGQERMSAVKTVIEEKTAELNEARHIELEMRNKLEERQKVLLENMKRQTYWQDKLEKLTVRKIGGLETENDQIITSYTRDELADLDKSLLKGEIAVLEERLQNSEVDLSVIEEYQRRVDEHTERSGDLAQAIEARDAAKRRSEELRRLRLEGFMAGFSTISLRLKEMYQMITMGGNAELELVDSLDPFSEGILFSVMPPKKSWKNISNLSGGEKTLSSLALVFALHHYKPTPLYVMDEIDAALDFRNVSIVASYIKERTKDAQFIVISLRNNMFELASRLVGVYKVNHMTKSVTVENRDYIMRS